jgi:hypothetical protein
LALAVNPFTPRVMSSVSGHSTFLETADLTEGIRCQVETVSSIMLIGGNPAEPEGNRRFLFLSILSIHEGHTICNRKLVTWTTADSDRFVLPKYKAVKKQGNQSAYAESDRTAFLSNQLAAHFELRIFFGLLLAAHLQEK